MYSVDADENRIYGVGYAKFHCINSTDMTEIWNASLPNSSGSEGNAVPMIVKDDGLYLIYFGTVLDPWEGTDNTGYVHCFDYDGNEITSVFSSDEYQPDIRDGQLIIDIWNIFFINQNMDLLIELKYTGMTGPVISSNFSLASTGSVAYLYGTKAVQNGTADYIFDRTHNLHFDIATDIVREGGPATHVYPFNATSPLSIQMK